MYNDSAWGRLKFCILPAFILGSAASFAACSSPTSLSPLEPAAQPARALVLPHPAPSAKPTPFAFKFTSVSDPNSPAYTRLYALDDLEQVVGVVQAGGSGGTDGFHSANPYDKFYNIIYPAASSTVLTAQNPGGKLYAGYFVKNGTTWGFIRNAGIYYALRDPHTPKGQSVNELLGINDDGIAVGFYVDSNGHDNAYEVASHQFIAIKPPGSVSTTANAITLAGNIAGSETLSSGATVGFYLHDGTYTQVSYPGSSETVANGLSDGVFDNIIVGSYVDASGKTHGFILRNGAEQDEMWQSVNEPNAKGVTVLTGMNNHHTMTGWYVDAKGDTHGFVATLTN